MAAAAPRCTPWRGKFLAFTQPGTTLCGDGTHSTCLNYLQQLGVGYVQIMPMYDFGSVDEAKPLTKQYNWGYDPINFNVPEGSYSTDPYHGEVRIRECRTMIQALHKAGIGVIMDVVYNHTYRHENVLNHVMPGYFFRENEDGSYSDGSGCSNEFASERPMARRYLIDSVLYWAKEYHLDGFRFDLMGIYDVETMNLLRAALDELPGGESILMYGEPWKGGPSVLQLPAGPERAAWKALCVFYDPLAETRVVSLPEGRWKLLSDGTSSALWQGESTVCTGEFSLPSCSAVIFGLL